MFILLRVIGVAFRWCLRVLIGTVDPGDSEHGTEPKNFDELAAIGFALAKSAALFPRFQTFFASHNCIGAIWVK